MVEDIQNLKYKENSHLVFILPRTFKSIISKNLVKIKASGTSKLTGTILFRQIKLEDSSFRTLLLTNFSAFKC